MSNTVKDSTPTAVTVSDRMREDYHQLVTEVRDWQRVTFPHATPASAAAHLRSEAKELAQAPTDAEEMADVFMLLVCIAGDTDLLGAVRRKFDINKARKWGERNAEGFVEHVRDDPQDDPAEARRDLYDQFLKSAEESAKRIAAMPLPTNVDFSDILEPADETPITNINCSSNSLGDPCLPQTLGEELRELHCQRCHREHTVWFAPNALWNKVAKDDEQFLCMDCFALLAEERGVTPTAWMLTEEDTTVSSALESLRRVSDDRSRLLTALDEMTQSRDNWKCRYDVEHHQILVGQDVVAALRDEQIAALRSPAHE